MTFEIKKTNQIIFKLITSIIFLLFCVAFLSPARFYQIYTVHITNSTIPCNYINFVDLLFAGCGIFSLLGLCFFNKLGNIRIPLLSILFIGIVILFNCFFITIFYDPEYCLELLSNLIIISSIILLFTYIKTFELNDTFKKTIFVCLFIIAFATILLKNYALFKGTGRAGSIGFGINETAMLCTIFLVYNLFFIKKKYLYRIIFAALSFYSIILTKSRRGLMFSLLILFAFLIISFARYLSSENTKRSKQQKIIVSFVIAFVLISSLTYVLINYRIEDLLPALKRGTEDGRNVIYHIALNSLNSNPIFGTFGSSKLFSDLYIHGHNHAHSVFLQYFCTHGIILGSIINFIIVLCFLTSTIILIKYIFFEGNLYFHKINGLQIMSACILFTNILYDIIGYSYWNPKLLALAILSCVIIGDYLLSLKKENIISAIVYEGVVC